MVTLELTLYQILKTFSGNGVVIIFVPDTVVRSWNSVFPYPVWPASHPFHTRTVLFRIREAKTEIENLCIHESIVEATATGTAI